MSLFQPCTWQDLVELIGTGSGLVHEFVKYPLEVGIRICASAAHLFDEGVNHGTAPAGVFAADEHPVFRPKLGGAYRIFYGVIVKINVTVFKAYGELGPFGMGVVERFAQGTPRSDTAAKDEVFGDSNKMLVDALRPSPSCSFAQGCICVALSQPCFKAIDFPDLEQQPCSDAGLIFLGFDEFAADVGEAADGGDCQAGVFGNEGVVGAKSIALEVSAK